MYTLDDFIKKLQDLKKIAENGEKTEVHILKQDSYFGDDFIEADVELSFAKIIGRNKLVPMESIRGDRKTKQIVSIF